MIHRRTSLLALIAGLACIGSIVVLGGLIYLVENHKMHLAERAQIRAENLARQEAMSTILRILETSREDRAALSTYLLAESEVIEFLTRIERIGERASVDLTIDALTTEAQDERFETLGVKLSLSGSYDAILSVITTLETLPHQSSLTSVALTKREGDIWGAAIDLRVTKIRTP